MIGGLAVGLGAIGSGPLVAGAELGQGRGVRVRPIRPAVVGQDPLDPDPEPGELDGRELKRPGRAGRSLIGHLDDEGDPAPIVDDDLEVVIAEGLAAGGFRPTVDPMAAAGGHPAELLVVLVEEGTRVTGLVADRGTGRAIGIPQPADAGPSERGIDRRSGMAGQRRQSVRATAALDPGGEDRLGLLDWQRPWRTTRSGAPASPRPQPG